MWPDICTCGEYRKIVLYVKKLKTIINWLVKALFQYNEIFEVILDKDGHLTSQPTQLPSVTNGHPPQSAARPRGALNWIFYTVNVVQNNVVPLGQLPTAAVQSLIEGKYCILCFIFSAIIIIIIQYKPT